jgi:Rieske Fe-S protein
MPNEGRERLDVRIDSEGREGLTGTTPASIYRSIHDAEQVTLPPDGRPMEAQPAWRTDFPIDWPQDQYVERREFMKFMVLTSLAFTVGQFWIAAKSWWHTPQDNASKGTRLASINDIAIGTAKTVAYPTEEDPGLLIRTGERTFVAYNQKCTHLSCAVIPQVADGVIRCPCHDGIFDLATGRPLAGPPRRPLARITIELRNNEIFATGVEARTV